MGEYLFAIENNVFCFNFFRTFYGQDCHYSHLLSEILEIFNNFPKVIYYWKWISQLCDPLSMSMWTKVSEDEV